MEIQTAAEVAEELRCSARKVKDTARAHAIGINLGGRAGWRFTAADKRALLDAMRPVRPEEPVKRHRKTRRSAAVQIT